MTKCYFENMTTLTYAGTCYIDCMALLVGPSVCFMYFTGVKHTPPSTYIHSVCVFRSVYVCTSVRLLCFVIKTFFFCCYCTQVFPLWGAYVLFVCSSALYKGHTSARMKDYWYVVTTPIIKTLIWWHSGYVCNVDAAWCSSRRHIYHVYCCSAMHHKHYMRMFGFIVIENNLWGGPFVITALHCLTLNLRA